MAKVLKFLGRTVGITFEWLLVLLIAFAFLIRTSAFQTYLGELATSYLSSELETEIRIGKIDIVFLNRVLLKDVYVEDLKKDTLASIGTIDVKIQSFNFDFDKITISEAAIEKGRIAIDRDKKTGVFNYAFIEDYFSSDKPKKKTGKNPEVTVKAIRLADIDLSYDDNRKERSPYGLDYDHMHFKHVNVTASNFIAREDGVMGLKLTGFKAKEQCGLELKNLGLSAIIHPKKGILLKNITIETPTTAIYASKFNLKVKSFDDFQHFNSNVIFDASIDSSKVDLTDVTYFVPALEGMDQTVYLSSKLSRPLDDLRMTELDLRFGKRTVVRGDFALPDFALENKAKLDEELEYCFVDFEDVEALHLPKSSTTAKIELQPIIKRLEYVELKRIHVAGQMNDFVMKSDKIGTGLGSVRLNNGIRFTELNEGGYAFTRTANSNYDVKIDSFQLGKFIDQDMFGSVTGSAFLTGVVGQKDAIRLTEVSGDFQRFGFNNYAYSNIKVTEGSFINNVFKSNIDINDPHLNMHYDGLVDVNTVQHFDFDLKITKADLADLHLMDDKDAKILANLEINIKGKDLDSYAGTVNVDEFEFQQASKRIVVPDLDLELKRGAASDQLTINSEVADILVDGKISSGNLVAALNNSFAELLPTVIKPQTIRKGASREFFTATVTAKNTGEILDLYYPELHIAEGTQAVMTYDSQLDVQTLKLNSNEIALIPISKDSTDVQKQFLRNIVVDEKLESGNLVASIKADRAAYNDSLYVDLFDVAVTGHQGSFETTVLWNQGKADPASINAEMQLKENNAISGVVKPSYFTVEGNKWEVKKAAAISFEEERIFVDDLSLERETQLIQLDGILSNNETDEVKLILKDVHVEEFSKILDPSLDIVGRLDGEANLKTPFTQAQAQGKLALSNFYMNKQEIGTVTLSDVSWNPKREALSMFGNLVYMDQETFTFEGSFYPLKENQNYNIDLKFKNTDLTFANAFVDPELVSNIKGNLVGKLKLRGPTAAPEITGDVTLNKGSAKIGMLGTTYRMDGKLNFNGKDDIIAGILPVYDEENNVAVADVQISHTDFTNFDINLDFWFNEEMVYGAYRRPFTGKFMVLNTQYKEGDIYYGKAYASGSANIAIHETVTEIDVHATTEKGTVVNLPMYGASEVGDFDFIEFYDPNAKTNTGDPKLSGVEMGLYLDITSDALVNLIFNPKTGDQIDARGKSNLEIKMKQNGALTMNGTYTVSEGGYNFVMYGIKERFELVQGGTITWTGSPYETNLNLQVQKMVVANFATLSGGSSGASKAIQCLMNVNGKLSKPEITLDLGDKGLSSSEKELIGRATATVEDTQKQWFSLVVNHTFIPLNGGGAGGTGGGGVKDIVGTYADEFLNKMSGGLNLGFQTSGGGTDTENKLSTEQNIGENIIITGSAGIATSGTGETSSSDFVGDVNIDILLNDDGTFRLNIFNESNDQNALGGSENGDFTQGVGLNYSEEFNKTKDSRVIKLVTDPFNRKGSRAPKKDNKIPTRKEEITPPSNQEPPKDEDDEEEKKKDPNNNVPE